MAEDAIRFEIVRDGLPMAMDALRVESSEEGYRSVDRLIAEWNDAMNTFDRVDEILMTAWSGSEIAGVGGMTHDPVVSDALRLRRFYIRKRFRRAGLGTRLANLLLERSRPAGKPVYVNAGTSIAPDFWKAIGFVDDPAAGHTHVWAGGGQKTSEDIKRRAI